MLTRTRGLLLATYFLAVLACKPHTAPPPAPAPAPVPPTAAETDSCAAAETRLEELGCRDDRGDPMWVNRKGERFQVTCRNVQEQGNVFLNPQCIANATSCEEANACPTNQ